MSSTSTAAGDTASKQSAGGVVSINSAGKRSDDDGSNPVTDANMNSSGKSPVPQPRFSAGIAFKKQQLKQLRAQCLVLLAFRNGLIPKELHLEIALENINPKEEEKDQTLHDGRSVSEVQLLADNLRI